MKTTPSAILTVCEGESRLDALERVASSRLRLSHLALTDGIVALSRIRDEKLWMYARDEDGVMFQDMRKPTWEKYLAIFTRRQGLSRSGVYGHLKTVQLWSLLSLPEEALHEIGVQAAAPVKLLVNVDGRTGELKLPPPEIIKGLPGDPNDPPIERVRRKVEEVLLLPAVPLRPADVSKALTVDVGSSPDIEIFETGKGDVFATYTRGDTYWDGVLIAADAIRKIPGSLRDYVFRRLNVLPFD